MDHFYSHTILVLFIRNCDCPQSHYQPLRNSRYTRYSSFLYPYIVLSVLTDNTAFALDSRITSQYFVGNIHSNPCCTCCYPMQTAINSARNHDVGSQTPWFLVQCISQQGRLTTLSKVILSPPLHVILIQLTKLQFYVGICARYLYSCVIKRQCCISNWGF